MVKRKELIDALHDELCIVSVDDTDIDHPAGVVFRCTTSGKYSIVPHDNVLNDALVVEIFLNLGLTPFPDHFPDLEDMYNVAEGIRSSENIPY